MSTQRLPKSSARAPKAPDPRRRTVLTSLALAALTASCGGGSSGGSPTPTPTPPPPPPPPPPAAAARLTLQGASMLSPDGKPIILRGMNEGTWGEMRSTDAPAIAAQGANVVRVLLRWWGLYGSPDTESRADGAPGHIDPAHLQQFLKEIQWCIDAGLWVIPAFDSNCGQNGMQNSAMVGYCDPSGKFPGGHNFFTDLSQRALFKEAWVHLAGILKDYSHIACYELLPEPLDGADATHAAEVSAFYQELMTAIEDQAGDRRTPFLVGARDGYNIQLADEAYIGAARWKDRVVYTGNLFLRTGNTTAENLASIDTRLGALAHMQASRQVPVFIQQFGVRTGDDKDGFYLDAGLTRMRTAGIGYTGWQWRQNTSNPDEYAIVLTDATTGADVIKTAVLARYASDWKA